MFELYLKSGFKSLYLQQVVQVNLNSSRINHVNITVLGEMIYLSSQDQILILEQVWNLMSFPVTCLKCRENAEVVKSDLSKDLFHRVVYTTTSKIVLFQRLLKLLVLIYYKAPILLRISHILSVIFWGIINWLEFWKEFFAGAFGITDIS